MPTLADELAKIEKMEGMDFPDESEERVAQRVEAARTARFYCSKAERSARSEEIRLNFDSIFSSFAIDNILSGVENDDSANLSKKLREANDEDTAKQNRAIRENLSSARADFLAEISKIYSVNFDYESQKTTKGFDEKRFRKIDVRVREAMANYESRMRNLKEKQKATENFKKQQQRLTDEFAEKISKLLFS